MKTSIALATYNGAQYLPEQLQSYVAQTRQPEELVICDDCSMDNTVEVCTAFAQVAPFEVILLQNDSNLGYNSTFERALSHCSGDLVFISDQDDVWFPEKVETILGFFRDHPACHLVIHDLEYCDQDLNPIGQRKIERIAEYTDPTKAYITGMATAVTRTFLGLSLPLPEGYDRNYDNWLHRCAYYSGVKQVLPEVLANYRRHEKTATSDGPLNVARRISGKEIRQHKRERKQSIPLSVQEETKADRLVNIADWLKAQRDELCGLAVIDDQEFPNILDQVDLEVRFHRHRSRFLAKPKGVRPFLLINIFRNTPYWNVRRMKKILKDTTR